MRLRSLAAIACIGVAAVPAAAQARPSTSSSKPPCVATPLTIKGQSALAFCGPATGVVHVGGKSYTFTQGLCSDDPKDGLALQLSLGVAVPSLTTNTNSGKPYFSIAISKRAGGAAVFAYLSGKVLVPKTSVKVSGGVPGAGSFTGSNGSATFRGSWSCHGVIYKT